MADFLTRLGEAEQKRLDRIKEIENEFERIDRNARWAHVDESIAALKSQVYERARKGDFQIIDGQKLMKGVFFPRDRSKKEYISSYEDLHHLFDEAKVLIKTGGKECDRLRSLFKTIHCEGDESQDYLCSRPGMLPTVETTKVRKLLLKFGGWNTARKGYIYFGQDSKDQLTAFIKKVNEEGIFITGFEYRWRGGQYVTLKNLEDRVEYKVKTKESFGWSWGEKGSFGFCLHYTVRF